MAAIATERGQPECAIRLFAAAEALREAISHPLPPVMRGEYDHDLAAARAHLSEETFASAWAAGQAMSLEQAIEEAQSLIRESAAPIRKPIELDGLISDTHWQQIAPLLPPAHQPHIGRPRLDDRQAMTAIFYALKIGCNWKALPRTLGASSTIHDRFREWHAAGVFERLWRVGLLPDTIADRLALTEQAQER